MHRGEELSAKYGSQIKKKNGKKEQDPLVRRKDGEKKLNRAIIV